MAILKRVNIFFIIVSMAILGRIKMEAKFETKYQIMTSFVVIVLKGDLRLQTAGYFNEKSRAEKQEPNKL